MRGRRNTFQMKANALLSYVALKGKVTRAQALADNPLNTHGQIAYWLDKLREQGKVRRHRGKGGAFAYTFKHF